MSQLERELVREGLLDQKQVDVLNLARVRRKYLSAIEQDLIEQRVVN